MKKLLTKLHVQSVLLLAAALLQSGLVMAQSAGGGILRSPVRFTLTDSP